MDYKQMAVQGIRWTSLASGLSFLIGLVQISFVTRYLSAEEIGMISLVMVVIGLGRVFSDAGMSNALIHFQDLNKEQINTLYWINVAVAAIVCIVLNIFSVPISMLFDTASLAPLIRIMSLAIIVASVGQQFYILLKRDLHFKTISLIDVIQRAVVFISIIIMLVYFEMGIISVIYGTIMGAIAYSILSFIFGVKHFKLPNLTNHNLSNIRDCLRFGGFQLTDRSVGYLSSNLDKLFIGRFFGMDILGFYELATVLINRPISIINPIFNNVSFPLFSKMQHDLPRLNQWYIKKIAIISLISAAIYCGMYAIRFELVDFIFGEKWELTATTLSIIFILGYFKSVSNPIGTYILALGRPDISLYFNLYQICIHVTLLTIGVSYFDYLTAILIYVVGAILLTIPAEYYMRYYLSKMDIIPHLSSILKHVAFAMIMVILVYYSRQLITGLELTSTIKMLVLISLGALYYGIINYLFNRKLIKELFVLIVK